MCSIDSKCKFGKSIHISSLHSFFYFFFFFTVFFFLPAQHGINISPHKRTSDYKYLKHILIFLFFFQIFLMKEKQQNNSKNNGAAALVTHIRTSLEDLGRLTDDAAKSVNIKKYLEFCARFHQYSFNNQILILLQCPNASQTLLRRRKDF